MCRFFLVCIFRNIVRSFLLRVLCSVRPSLRLLTIVQEKQNEVYNANVTHFAVHVSR